MGQTDMELLPYRLEAFERHVKNLDQYTDQEIVDTVRSSRVALVQRGRAGCDLFVAGYNVAWGTTHATLSIRAGEQIRIILKSSALKYAQDHPELATKAHKVIEGVKSKYIIFEVEDNE